MENKSFSELIEKYRKDELTENEKEYVEKEIEKAEIIQDLIFEKEDITNDFHLEKSTEIDTTEIKKELRKKNRKQGIIIIGVVFALLLIVTIIIPSVVNNYYYNPLSDKRDGEISEFEFEQKVLNDVRPSGLNLIGLGVEKTGVGEYSVSKAYGDTFTNQIYNSMYSINKGKEEMIQTNREAGDMVQETISALPKFGDNKSNERREQQIKKVKQLPESSWIKVKIVFNEPLKVADMNKLLKKYNIIHPLYGNVSVDDHRDFVGSEEFGFTYHYLANYPNIPSNRTGTSKYQDIFVDKQLTANTEPKLIENHFKSSLSYLVDKSKEKKRLQVAADFEFQKESEQNKSLVEALKYVEKNGVTISSVTIAIKPNVFEELLDDERVTASSVIDALLFAPHLDKDY